MRPHRLLISAFGPFAGTEEVDLDALGAAGLFLLHGETGAGKTTVLDAVGFALYGQVPGARQAARRLRSDHAAPEVRTEVCLELTLGGRRLEVTRWPEWERPKKRGEGTTTEKAGARLRERVGDAWETVSTRVDEVSAELADLLGMSAAQFFQVVLLPQGEFARFLRAPSDERGRLLERLFDLGRFADVEAWLAARRREAAARVEEAQTRVRTVAARVAEAAGAAEVPEEPDLAWVGGLGTVAEADRGRAEAAAAVARGRAAQAQEALDLARRTAERQRRRREADARAAALQVAAPVQAERRRRLQEARRAAAVVPSVAALRAARARTETAADQDRAARAVRVGLGDTAEPGREPGALRAMAAAARAEVGRLTDLAVLEEGLAARRRQVAALRDEVAAAAAAAAGLRDERAALPERRRALEAALGPARDARASLAARAEAAASAARLVRAAEERDEVAAHLAAARERELVAREAAVDAVERHQELRARRIDGMAAELAERLEPDAPCPVCGSVEHPDLTEMAPDGVSDADEQRAAEAVSVTSAVAADAQRVAAEVRAEDARLRGALDQDADTAVAVLRGRAAAAQQEHADAAALAARVPELEVALAGLEGERTRLEEALAAADGRVREGGARGAELAAALDRDEAAVAAARGGCASVAARRAVLARRAEASDAAAATAERLAREREALDEAAARVAEVASGAGFPDAAAAEAAACEPAEVAELERRVAAHDEEEAAVRALLADADLQVALEPPADPEAARQVLERATREAEEAVAVHDAAERRCLALARLADELAGRLADLAPLAAASREVRALADLAAGQGQNQLKMRLSAFVLAARLEEVAEAASARLARMTQGRYALAHTDAGRGNARAGLGLLVRDAWTGQDRDTATLSGGETFLASLALALGLADVVTAESGGLRLDTLFVDEGFGSLDPEALEEVMDVLDGLRDGGRVVGLVSHVAELQQRIPTRLHVAKGRSGSTVRLVSG